MHHQGSRFQSVWESEKESGLVAIGLVIGLIAIGPLTIHWWWSDSFDLNFWRSFSFFSPVSKRLLGTTKSENCLHSGQHFANSTSSWSTYVILRHFFRHSKQNTWLQELISPKHFPFFFHSLISSKQMPHSSHAFVILAPVTWSPKVIHFDSLRLKH